MEASSELNSENQVSGQTVCFCFAGRIQHMEILLNYIAILLHRGLIDRFDIWNFAWNQSDFDYVNSLSNIHPKIKVRYCGENIVTRGSDGVGAKFKQLYSQEYINKNKEDVYIKIDDDIAFVEVSQFENFVNQIRANKESFITTAHVFNRYFRTSRFYAAVIHYKFLRSKGMASSLWTVLKMLPSLTIHDVKTFIQHQRSPIDVLPSGRVSVNFCGWTSDKWDAINYTFSKRKTGLDDEIVLSFHIPESLGLKNAIDTKFKVVHYSFGGQVPLDDNILAGYNLLSQKILNNEGIDSLTTQK